MLKDHGIIRHFIPIHNAARLIQLSFDCLANVGDCFGRGFSRIVLNICPAIETGPLRECTNTWIKDILFYLVQLTLVDLHGDRVAIGLNKVHCQASIFTSLRNNVDGEGAGFEGDIAVDRGDGGHVAFVANFFMIDIDGIKPDKAVAVDGDLDRFTFLRLPLVAILVTDGDVIGGENGAPVRSGGCIVGIGGEERADALEEAAFRRQLVLGLDRTAGRQNTGNGNCSIRCFECGLFQTLGQFLHLLIERGELEITRDDHVGRCGDPVDHPSDELESVFFRSGGKLAKGGVLFNNTLRGSSVVRDEGHGIVGHFFFFILCRNFELTGDDGLGGDFGLAVHPGDEALALQFGCLRQLADGAVLGYGLAGNDVAVHIEEDGEVRIGFDLAITVHKVCGVDRILGIDIQFGDEGHVGGDHVPVLVCPVTEEVSEVRIGRGAVDLDIVRGQVDGLGTEVDGAALGGKVGQARLLAGNLRGLNFGKRLFGLFRFFYFFHFELGNHSTRVNEFEVCIQGDIVTQQRQNLVTGDLGSGIDEGAVCVIDGPGTELISARRLGKDGRDDGLGHMDVESDLVLLGIGGIDKDTALAGDIGHDDIGLGFCLFLLLGLFRCNRCRNLVTRNDLTGRDNDQEGGEGVRAEAPGALGFGMGGLEDVDLALVDVPLVIPVQGQQGKDRLEGLILIHLGSGDSNVVPATGAAEILALAFLIDNIDDGPVGAVNTQFLLESETVEIELFGVRASEIELMRLIDILDRLRLAVNELTQLCRHGRLCLGIAVDGNGETAIDRADAELSVILRLLDRRLVNHVHIGVVRDLVGGDGLIGQRRIRHSTVCAFCSGCNLNRAAHLRRRKLAESSESGNGVIRLGEHAYRRHAQQHGKHQYNAQHFLELHTSVLL